MRILTASSALTIIRYVAKRRLATYRRAGEPLTGPLAERITALDVVLATAQRVARRAA